MSKLVIPGLKPEDSVRFYLTGEFYGETPSSISFPIDIPKACPLISKTNIGLNVRAASDEVVRNNATIFPFNYYSKLTLSKKNFYKIRLRLGQRKDRGSLKVGDKVLVDVPSGSPLSNLDGQVFPIIASGPTSNNEAFIVDLEIPNSRAVSQPRGSVTNSNLTEDYAIRKFKEFQITITKNVFDNLINVRNPLKGTLVSQIIDIPIYAYKNFEGENSAKEPRLLFLNNTEINEKTPPAYSQNLVDAYLVGNSYKKRLRSDEKRNFLFYVAIARYRYANNKWSGQWLQVNKENKAIWGKAVLARGN
jgi:hypothetical protein